MIPAIQVIRPHQVGLLGQVVRVRLDRPAKQRTINQSTFRIVCCGGSYV